VGQHTLNRHLTALDDKSTKGIKFQSLSHNPVYP
jgi:hypothetical protein